MKGKFIALLLPLLMVGCKTTEPLYYYGSYNTAVYSYLQGEGTTLEEQITVLEETIQNASANSKPVAPGIHAHLGMLYFESGDTNQGKLHFVQEKQLFPESAQYIDFLLSSANGA